MPRVEAGTLPRPEREPTDVETAKLQAEIQRLYRQMEHDPTEKRLAKIRALISRELLKLLPLAVRSAKRGKVSLLRLILRYAK